MHGAVLGHPINVTHYEQIFLKGDLKDVSEGLSLSTSFFISANFLRGKGNDPVGQRHCNYMMVN
jgi:hypothetical protein